MGSGDSGIGQLRDLRVWVEAKSVATQVYRLTAGWPSEERFSLTRQVRSAAVSIPANIAEGVGRGRPREIVRFSRIAIGSAYEVFTFMDIAAEVIQDLDEVDFADGQRRLIGLIRQLKAFAAHHGTRVREDGEPSYDAHPTPHSPLPTSAAAGRLES